MKKRFFKFLILLLFIIIIVVSFYYIKKLVSNKTISGNIDSGNSHQTENLRFIQTNTQYSFKKNIGIATKDTTDLDEYSSVINESKKMINGTNYANINSVSVPTGQANTNLTSVQVEAIAGNLQFDTLNNYNFRDGLFFDNDVELLPKILFLEDMKDAYYEYNGKIYYIPVVSCAKEDERIIYRNGLTLYRNVSKIIYNGNIISFNLDDYYAEIDLKNIFDCYYLTAPASNMYIYKNYEIPNFKNCISLITYNGSTSKALLRAVEDGTVDMCFVPLNIAGNVGNYNNLFYQNLSITNVDSDETHKFRLIYKIDDDFILLENK